MTSKILVVDDDTEIRKVTGIYLENEGYEVIKAENGEQALSIIAETQIDLVLLDIMMPGMDGIETCMKIRENNIMPIIFLSAKSEDLDKIQGLASGADDYITKPFNAMELMARVKSQLRRYIKYSPVQSIDKNIIEIGNLTINTDTRQVFIGDKEVRLTPKEFDILELLARANSITVLEYNIMALITFATGIAVFLIVFLLLVNNKIKYIKYISKQVNKIANEELGLSLKVRGNDELAELCKNINIMSKQLKEKFDYERELENTKNELITNVSHDLRTPLTAIIGYLDILTNEKYKAKEEKEYLNSAYNLSIKLKKLIDELFEYTKLSSSDISLELVEADVGSILTQILGEYAPVFETKGLGIITYISDTKLPVKIDIEKIIRVFDNVLGNAEKYSSKPSDIIVRAYRNEDNIIISVSNKGKDIKKDKLDKMFEKFYRMDNSRSSKIEGSGLGLAISKKIVELHNGHIRAESNEDIVTINIRLPIAK
ncbi:response regulator [Clostridium sp. A1-XYC3]|uniref:Stage 0 sporulation protein A homolog n=2 Tax=Clostridium tanneri TaxID=3037988 RepID=A0ABU4JPD4_9CLOT|nr:response regulator [Clostridium sp. A1-XYC3]MDW8799972.1 response regulator [Clostridium sp. A1-XYC3]